MTLEIAAQIEALVEAQRRLKEAQEESARVREEARQTRAYFHKVRDTPPRYSASKRGR